MTTEEFFKKLASKLELKNSDRNKISQKHNSLRERLRDKLLVEEDFLTGSYYRHTIICPRDDKKFDVDLFLAFNKEDYGETELPNLLNEIKYNLEKIKNEDDDIEKIQEQKRSIGIVYKGNFQIDVVPAIQIEADELYKIFDKSTQQAIESNPKLHEKNLTSANEASEFKGIKRLVPIVKLLKYWKREKCDYVKSFHLEMLAVEILDGERINSYSQGIAKFFSNAEQNLQLAGMKDPANEDNIIDEYLDKDSTREKLLVLINEENKIAENAIKLEKEDKNDEAVKEWKKIFEKNENYNSSKNQSSPSEPILTHKNPPKPWCNV